MAPHERWRDPLIRAQQIRAERTRMHLLVTTAQTPHSSRVRVAGLLVNPAPALRNMHAEQLLLWALGTGQDAINLADRMLDRIGASSVVTVGHLTLRQRRMLRELLIHPEEE